MSLNSALIKSYRAENKANGDADESALRANTYGDFLYRRMRCRVKHRSLETEWPASLRGEIENTTTADLAYFLLAQIATPEEALVFCPMQHVAMSELNLEYEAVLAQYDLEHDDLVACSMITLIADWYCLRQAGTLSRPYISVRNLKIYRCLAGVAVMPELQANESHALFFNTFLIGLKRSLLRAFSDGSQ